MAEHNGQTELRDQPVGELVKQLSEQTSALVRKEVELAKAELAVKGKKAGLGADRHAGLRRGRRGAGTPGQEQGAGGNAAGPGAGGRFD